MQTLNSQIWPTLGTHLECPQSMISLTPERNTPKFRWQKCWNMWTRNQLNLCAMIRGNWMQLGWCSELNGQTSLDFFAWVMASLGHTMPYSEFELFLGTRHSWVSSRSLLGKTAFKLFSFDLIWERLIFFLVSRLNHVYRAVHIFHSIH